MTDTTDLAVLADDTLDAELTGSERDLELARALYDGALDRYSARVEERFRRRVLACYPAATHLEFWPATYDNGDGLSLQGIYDADGTLLEDDLNDTGLDGSMLEVALADLHGTDDDYTMFLHPTPDPALRAALLAAVDLLPARLQPPARLTAQAVLDGERSHGDPIAVDGMDANVEREIQHAIDSAWDRYRLRYLAPGMGVEVRCWPDDERREGRIVALHPGASAPITVDVSYPADYRGPDGDEPINPSNYSTERILFADATAAVLA
jgi:hypothetical protein